MQPSKQRHLTPAKRTQRLAYLIDVDGILIPEARVIPGAVEFLGRLRAALRKPGTHSENAIMLGDREVLAVDKIVLSTACS